MGHNPSEENSITFSVFPDEGIRVARFRGCIDEGILLAAYEHLVTAADFDPGLDDIVDLSGISSFAFSNQGLQLLVDRLAQLDPLGYRTRVAMVAPTDVAYGMGRMYEMLRETTGSSTEEIRLFKKYDDAHAWLCAAKTDQTSLTKEMP